MFHLTLFQLIGLFVAVYVVIWAVKSLITHYIARYIIKKRFCMNCLDNGQGHLNLDSPWRVNTGDNVPIFLCESCKRQEFPAEVGEFAEARGYIVKEVNDHPKQ